jgi:hypothetical protein
VYISPVPKKLPKEITSFSPWPRQIEAAGKGKGKKEKRRRAKGNELLLVSGKGQG